MPVAAEAPPRAAPAADDAIPALTSLRFVAAFAVVVLHYRDLLGPMPDWLFRAIVGGQYGVTFFFILSGFILTYKYKDWFAHGVTDPAYWRFQRFRLARIYPVYLVGLLLDTPWHLIERIQVGQLAESGITYWSSWLLNLVGLQSWIPAVPYAMFWNTPAWSVAAEFFFYATFPFLTVLIWRRVTSLPGLLAAFVGVVVLGTAAYAVVIHLLVFVWRVSSEAQYIVMVYNPLLRYSEFFAGCLAGHYFLRTRQQTCYFGAKLFDNATGRHLVLAACTLAIGLRILSPDYTGPSGERWLFDVATKYSFYILPFSLVILAFANGPTVLTPLLENRVLILLGEASYALYIVHWSVTTFLRMGFLGSLGTPIVHGLLMLATVGLSVACYRWIEVPWRRRLRGPSSRASAEPSPAANSTTHLHPAA